MRERLMLSKTFVQMGLAQPANFGGTHRDRNRSGNSPTTTTFHDTQQRSALVLFFSSRGTLAQIVKMGAKGYDKSQNLRNAQSRSNERLTISFLHSRVATGNKLRMTLGLPVYVYTTPRPALKTSKSASKRRNKSERLKKPGHKTARTVPAN